MASLSDILNSPLSPPPAGVESNFINPESDGYVLIVIESICLVLMVCFTAIRVYAKGFVARKVTWDDLTFIIGFVLSLIYYILNIVGVRSCYVGYNAWDVKVGQLSASDFFLTSYLQGLINPAGLGFIKLTFFLLYFQIFRPLERMRIAIWFGAIFSTLFYTLIVVLAFIFTTPRPHESFATHLVSSDEQNEIHLAVPQAAISVVIDLYILILPIYGVWQLQLSRERKIGVSLVFLTGGMAVLASILTLYYRVQLNSTTNLLRILQPTLITSLVEMHIGIICTCAPALSQILRFTKTKTTTKGSKGSSMALNYVRQKSSGSEASAPYSEVIDDPDTMDELSPHNGRIHGHKNSQSVQTYIESGRTGGKGQNAIHMKRDIHQEWERNAGAGQKYEPEWRDGSMV